MSIFRASPVKFEVTDSDGDVAAIVEMFDGHSATVSMKGYCITLDDWVELSASITSAIAKMELEV